MRWVQAFEVMLDPEEEYALQRKVLNKLLTLSWSLTTRSWAVLQPVEVSEEKQARRTVANSCFFSNLFFFLSQYLRLLKGRTWIPLPVWEGADPACIMITRNIWAHLASRQRCKQPWSMTPRNFSCLPNLSELSLKRGDIVPVLERRSWNMQYFGYN